MLSELSERGDEEPGKPHTFALAVNPNTIHSVVPVANTDQRKVVLAECAIQDPKDRLPGKMNLNTVDEEFLRDMLEVVGTDEAIVDELLYLRDRPQGISNLVELKTIPSITPDDLRNLTRRFDVVSNVFTIASRGRSVATGVECEIVAVVDRSTIPVRILEYREQ